ncbi:MAG: insulinase family protein [Acidobacteria bacterium]|nr:insulinase family protein [Acidobacteriota bacterium]
MAKETNTLDVVRLRAARLLILCVALFTITSGLSLAQTKGDAPLGAKKADEVAATAESLVTEFDVNGLKVLVKRRAGSQTVAAGLFLRGGAGNVTAQNAGIEALMWDAATEGSQSFPRELLHKELSRMGTQLGYSMAYDYSVLSVGSTKQNFERSWEIFADAAMRPSFAPEDFARVRSRMVVARSGEEDTPDSYLEVLQSRLAYAGHPYANDPEGTAESVGRLTLEDVRRYHQQMMQTSRLLLVVVGDLDAAQVRDRVAATLGKLPRGDYRPAPPPSLAFAAPAVEITRRSIPTNYIQGVFSAPPLTDPDIYPMQIAASLLNDRIYLEVRVKRNLSYAPAAFLRDQGASLGGVYVTATAERTNEAVRVMMNEIARLQRERAEPSDISSQVSGYLTRYYIGQETNAAQAGELAKYELIGGGWRNSTHYLERLRAVTPADVQRVAQKYMRNLRFVVLGDPTGVDQKVFTVAAAGE